MRHAAEIFTRQKHTEFYSYFRRYKNLECVVLIPYEKVFFIGKFCNNSRNSINRRWNGSLNKIVPGEVYSSIADIPEIEQLI